MPFTTVRISAVEPIITCPSPSYVPQCTELSIRQLALVAVVAPESIAVTDEMVPVAKLLFFQTNNQRLVEVFDGFVESFVICVLQVAALRRRGVAAGLTHRSSVLGAC